MNKIVYMLNNGFQNDEIKSYINDHHDEINDDSARCRWTPLGTACSNGNVEIVKYLIAKQADIENGSEYHTCLFATLLNKAMNENNKVEIIKSLVSAGANINASPRSYCAGLGKDSYPLTELRKEITLLDIAVIYKETKVFNCLIQLGADRRNVLYPKLVDQYYQRKFLHRLFLFGLYYDFTDNKPNSTLALYGSVFPKDLAKQIIDYTGKDVSEHGNILSDKEKLSEENVAQNSYRNCNII